MGEVAAMLSSRSRSMASDIQAPRRRPVESLAVNPGQSPRTVTAAIQVHIFRRAQKNRDMAVPTGRERDGFPESITYDNGSEFASRIVEAWAMEHEIRLCFIRPGRPVEKGFAESLNGRLRDECLNVS